MRYRDLSGSLAKGLAPLWLITGTEPLLMIEAADAVRAQARALHYEEREILNASASWDWSQLIDSCQSMSLFSQKKIVELRLASFRPGVKGAEALQTLSEMTRRGDLVDTVVIVTMPMDWSIKKLAWYKALTGAAEVVECDPVTASELPQWFTERLRRQGQSAEPAALRLLCERCEGNLLAAKQELLKLSYQYPKDAAITAEMIENAVSDVSRFDSENLLEATMGGDAAKAARIVESLKAEGETIPGFLWMLADEIRMAAKARALFERGNPMMDAVRSCGAYGLKTARVKACATRMNSKRLAAALMLCADIDRLAKGLTVKTKNSDPWCEVTSLVTFVAGR